MALQNFSPFLKEGDSYSLMALQNFSPFLKGDEGGLRSRERFSEKTIIILLAPL
jgi:hypothetical protein